MKRENLGSGRDLAGLYGYALGSARESRGWYCKTRHILGPAVTRHRIAFLTAIIKLRLTTISDRRGDVLGEGSVEYQASFDPEPAIELLKEVPIA
ncbi:MAG TPA: hypothetical protein VHI52_09240 [Verrucomicrobiae bacterium]|nr:hypothetical protein [Verrucomicrobiae bacterium]